MCIVLFMHLCKPDVPYTSYIPHFLSEKDESEVTGKLQI